MPAAANPPVYPQLTWEEAADIITIVRTRREQEGRLSAVDYDRICREELTRHRANLTHIPPLPPVLPAFLNCHCRYGDSEVSATTDQANVVVSTVVEDTFPVALAECKMELVEAWECVLDNCRL